METFPKSVRGYYGATFVGFFVNFSQSGIKPGINSVLVVTDLAVCGRDSSLVVRADVSTDDLLRIRGKGKG
jgi:hypothetical protein